MVQILSDPNQFSHFESSYLQLRKAEGRILNDGQLLALPNVQGLNQQLDAEWKVRAKNFQKLKHYFLSATKSTHILDVGCGNGWAAAGMADNNRLQVTAVDINRLELEQADRVFQKPNLQFCFGDVFEDIFPASSFDVIVLNASLQYFPDLKKLIKRLFYFLKPDGEIHFLDTPIYEKEEIPAAKERTLEYYSGMGFPEMAHQYFHHSWEELHSFNPIKMDEQNKWWRLFSRKQAGHLHWIRIRKKDQGM